MSTETDIPTTHMAILLPMDTPLAYALEHALAYGNGLGFEIVPFRTWLTLQLVNRAYHRRFRGRVVGDFLAYLERRIEAYTAPMVFTDVTVCGPCIMSIIGGAPIARNHVSPVHIVGHPQATMSPVLVAFSSHRFAWRDRAMVTADVVVGEGRTIRVIRAPDAAVAAEYVDDQYIGSYSAGRLRLSFESYTVSMMMDLFCCSTDGIEGAV